VRIPLKASSSMRWAFLHMVSHKPIGQSASHRCNTAKWGRTTRASTALVAAAKPVQEHELAQKRCERCCKRLSKWSTKSIYVWGGAATRC